MKQIQSQYGGSSITEPQLEAVSATGCRQPSASCNARLDQFFPQWWDNRVPRPAGTNTVNKPASPPWPLNGTGFVCAARQPAEPDGLERLVHAERLGHVAGVRRSRRDQDGLRGRHRSATTVYVHASLLLWSRRPRLRSSPEIGASVAPCSDGRSRCDKTATPCSRTSEHQRRTRRAPNGGECSDYNGHNAT
jgi:hypothetical protein